MLSEKGFLVTSAIFSEPSRTKEDKGTEVPRRQIQTLFNTHPAQKSKLPAISHSGPPDPFFSTWARSPSVQRLSYNWWRCPALSGDQQVWQCAQAFTMIGACVTQVGEVTSKGFAYASEKYSAPAPHVSPSDSRVPKVL